MPQVCSVPDDGEPGRAQEVGPDVLSGRIGLWIAAQPGQQRVCPTQRNQPPVPFQQLAVNTVPSYAPLEDAIEER